MNSPDATSSRRSSVGVNVFELLTQVIVFNLHKFLDERNDAVLLPFSKPGYSGKLMISADAFMIFEITDFLGPPRLSACGWEWNNVSSRRLGFRHEVEELVPARGSDHVGLVNAILASLSGNHCDGF